MEEFILGNFRDTLRDLKFGSFAIKNIGGMVEIHGSDEGTTERLFDILSNSSGREDISDELYGCERILGKLFSCFIRTNSLGEIDETMYKDAIKSLTHQKKFKA